MPKNVNRVRGRDGVNRYYYRPRDGRPNMRLPDITDPGFAAAHAAAEAQRTPLGIGESRSIPGSVGRRSPNICHRRPSSPIGATAGAGRKGLPTKSAGYLTASAAASGRTASDSAIDRSSVCNNSMCRRSSMTCARYRRRRAIC
jgi:hypothetical protein